MRKILLGVVIGVALSGLVFSFFDRTIEETVASSQREADAEVRSVSEVGAGPATHSEIANQSAGRQAEPAAALPSVGFTPNGNAAPDDSVPSIESAAAREAQLIVEIDQARRTLDLASAELQALAINRMLADNPIVSPVPLPPEFDWISENSYRGLFHERFQREVIDSAWSMIFWGMSRNYQQPQSLVAQATE